MRACFVALTWIMLSAGAVAQAPPLSTGRPGATESPMAVPKGYLQIETEIAAQARSRDGDVRETETRAAATALRYGLARGTDVELIAAPYARVRVRDRATGAETTREGFGDVTLRLRRMVAGADGEGPAVALIGFATLPTAGEGLGADRLEGGLIATASGALTGKLGWTLTGGIAAIHAGGYRGDATAAVNLSYALTEHFGLYVEAAAERAAGAGEAAATANAGVTWLTGATTQLDAGVNVGVAGAAPDAELFLGWSHRF
ncbi:MAG: transporter [Hyphomonadaceae bacterium]